MKREKDREMQTLFYSGSTSPTYVHSPQTSFEWGFH